MPEANEGVKQVVQDLQAADALAFVLLGLATAVN